MIFGQLESFALDLPEATKSYPFGEDVPVFKVFDKVFLLMDERKGHEEINIKVDPEEAPMLRQQFKAVVPGWHMDKRHGNTVILDGSIQTGIIEDWIQDSFDLVVAKMTRKDQARLRTD